MTRHKIEELSVVRTLVDLKADDGRTVPAGTIATVMDIDPTWYLLDVAMDDDNGDPYETVGAKPDQIEPYTP